jgi:hypothetical protein
LAKDIAQALADERAAALEEAAAIANSHSKRPLGKLQFADKELHEAVRNEERGERIAAQVIEKAIRALVA